ncbi:alpha/beta fold hydrolase [Natrialbaceae archaeon A-arb3/5]
MLDLPDEWTTGTVSSADVDLQYYRTGEGKPIVFAHGFLDTGQRWIPLAEELAANYAVIAYDARGHGRSDAPETGYRLADRIGDLHRIVDELNLDNSVLVGHSLGSGTVGWAAARQPDLPAGISYRAGLFPRAAE